ncbi:hypothetical protein [Devosia ginsengisoli]|uniref:hypothetical protein n=1 Tax=Devosia ginsengisoli TaxID=400770 RepID=UPI0026F1F132|nr:hypothetical protein [Devosia ginsengisoli]MCR6673677.1 hypothetical protein [Devosia ginsengisoli]
MVKPLAAILVMLMLFAGPAALAQPVSYPEPADPLPGRAGGTYADLVQLVAPGIVIDGSSYAGGQSLDIRHLADWDDPGVTLAATGRLHISALPVGSQLALLLDFGTAADEVSELDILALFDLADTPRLLDAANANLDRSTSFSKPFPAGLGEGADLLLIQGTHHNSGQGYSLTALTLVRDGRFELIDTILTFRENNCAFERNQNLDVKPITAEPFADIVASVFEQTDIPADACTDPTPPAAGTRTITVTYRWDPAAGRYAADSDAFDILARENEARF